MILPSPGKLSLLCLAALLFASQKVTADFPEVEKVNTPSTALNGVPFTLELDLRWTNKSTPDTFFNYDVKTDGDKLVSSGKIPLADESGVRQRSVSLKNIVITDNGWANLQVTISSESDSTSTSTPATASAKVHVIPGVLTVVPVIVLVVLAVATRQVLVALFCGIFLSSLFIGGYNPVTAFLRTLDTYMLNAVTDPDHAKIILFTFWLSALLALVQKSGGAHGLAAIFSKHSSSRQSAQWATYALGCIVFFDDYASCLIVGSQMRPITDRALISREKLAFLTHSTAAPPSSLIPLSSWIGYEIGLIGDQLVKAGDTSNSFMTFLETMPSRFFPIFMLFFVAVQIAFRKDFGPMLRAERRAIHEGKLREDDEVDGGDAQEIVVVKNKPIRSANAIVPIGVTVIVIIVGLLMSGYSKSVELAASDPTIIPSEITTMSGNGDSYGSLIWGTFMGCIVATAMYKAQNILTLKESIETWLQGLQSVVEALMTLILAWSIGAALSEIGTASYITSALQGQLDPSGVPSLVFVISCFISSCTGSSWGTMSIIFPLACQLASNLRPNDHAFLVQVISSILTGSIFGDQCSPLSDTSILSALATKVSVTAHVWSQLPYAVLVALTSVLVGYLPVGYDLYPSWAGLLIGCALLTLVIYFVGSNPEDEKCSRFAAMLGGDYVGSAPDLGANEKEQDDAQE